MVSNGWVYWFPFVLYCDILLNHCIIHCTAIFKEIEYSSNIDTSSIAYLLRSYHVRIVKGVLNTSSTVKYKAKQIPFRIHGSRLDDTLWLILLLNQSDSPYSTIARRSSEYIIAGSALSWFSYLSNRTPGWITDGSLYEVHNQFLRAFVTPPRKEIILCLKNIRILTRS